MKKLYFYYLGVLVLSFLGVVSYYHFVAESKDISDTAPIVDDPEHGFTQYAVAAPVGPLRQNTSSNLELDPVDLFNSLPDEITLVRSLSAVDFSLYLEDFVSLAMERDRNAFESFCTDKAATIRAGETIVLRKQRKITVRGRSILAIAFRVKGFPQEYYAPLESILYAYDASVVGLLHDYPEVFEIEKQEEAERQAARGRAEAENLALKQEAERAKLEAQKKPETKQGNQDSAKVSQARRAYYTKIWSAIRQNWELPEFLKSQHLETVLVVTVRRDGKILDLKVEKGSGNAAYDDSAKQAVRKADPLPPFPDIYTAPQEEIALRFTPELLS